MVSFRVSWLSLIIATYSSFRHYFLPDNSQSKKERPILMNFVVQYFPRASNRFLSSFRCPPLSQSLAKGNLGISWLAKINQVVSLENLLVHPPWHIASLKLNQIRVLLGRHSRDWGLSCCRNQQMPSYNISFIAQICIFEHKLYKLS